MPTVETYVEVDVDLDDFDTDDLLDELEKRGCLPPEADVDSTELVTAIYQNRRLGKDYQNELDQLIYQVIGRII